MIAGSVKVAAREEETVVVAGTLKADKPKRSSSHEIRQRIVLATTPESRHELIEEL